MQQTALHTTTGDNGNVNPQQGRGARSTHSTCPLTTRPCHATAAPTTHSLQVFVAQGKRRRCESTILESDSLIKALQQQSELDHKSLTDIIQV